jgi:hypothetical protein
MAVSGIGTCLFTATPATKKRTLILHANIRNKTQQALCARDWQVQCLMQASSLADLGAIEQLQARLDLHVRGLIKHTVSFLNSQEYKFQMVKINQHYRGK